MSYLSFDANCTMTNIYAALESNVVYSKRVCI